MQIKCKSPHFYWHSQYHWWWVLPALSPAVWSQAWQCETSVGLARGCIRHREFPSLILHKLHIKLLQHLFFLLLPDLHSLNKGGDLYGKGMRSVSPHVVPWVSHHHMIPVMELKMLTDPVLPICSSWRALGRHLKDGHTTQHAGLTAEEQGWGAGTFGRG